MGAVLVILIPNQHISILQFVVFTEQQITEELYEEGLVWLYAFLGITIIGTDKRISEIPRVLGKDIINHIESQCAWIFYQNTTIVRVLSSQKAWTCHRLAQKRVR